MKHIHTTTTTTTTTTSTTAAAAATTENNKNTESYFIFQWTFTELVKLYNANTPTFSCNNFVLVIYSIAQSSNTLGNRAIASRARTSVLIEPEHARDVIIIQRRLPECTKRQNTYDTHDTSKHFLSAEQQITMFAKSRLKNHSSDTAEES